MEYVEYMRQQFGSDAADVRHELFYLHAGRSQVAAGVRALAALLRDSWLLLRCTSAGLSAQGHKQAILLTTLAGASGWSTLQRTLPALAAAGYAPLVLLHPRLAIDDISPALPCIRPARPGLQAWRSALRVFIATLRQAQPLLLASCLARRVLWSASLRRTLAGSRGVVLLHNDFDLMSRAAIDQGLTSICVQHGIATDEFFPTQADCYLVWGDASRQVFEANGTPSAQLVEDALGRGERTEQATRAPEGIALLSQTHAQILGEGIGEALATFAHALLQIAPDARILLHPQENQPYSGAAARATRRPPHPELRPGPPYRNWWWATAPLPCWRPHWPGIGWWRCSWNCRETGRYARQWRRLCRPRQPCKWPASTSACVMTRPFARPPDRPRPNGCAATLPGKPAGLPACCNGLSSRQRWSPWHDRTGTACQ